MSAESGGRTGLQGKLSQWLRGRRPKEAAAGQEAGREALLLAAASAGLPLAPAAHPAPGYRCSCDRVGCPTPARHPVSFAWQTQSTTDRAQIERWARHQPQANFITATGMVHDVLDVPLEAGREALERLLGSGIEVGPVAESDDGRLLFFTLTRGTPRRRTSGGRANWTATPRRPTNTPACAGTAGAPTSSYRPRGCPAIRPCTGSAAWNTRCPTR